MLGPGFFLLRWRVRVPRTCHSQQGCVRVRFFSQGHPGQRGDPRGGLGRAPTTSGVQTVHRKGLPSWETCVRPEPHPGGASAPGFWSCPPRPSWLRVPTCLAPAVPAYACRAGTSGQHLPCTPQDPRRELTAQVGSPHARCHCQPASLLLFHGPVPPDLCPPRTGRARRAWDAL